MDPYLNFIAWIAVTGNEKLFTTGMPQ